MIDIIVGNTYKTNNCGMIKVIDYKSHDNVTVVFLDTGSVKVTRTRQIRTGEIKDGNKRSVFGVGYMGYGKYKSKHLGKTTDEYDCWRLMMCRCYANYESNGYNSYDDCTVCDEWHNFQNFAEWYSENHPQDGGKYHLDKDLSCYGDKGNLYSPETCAFVTPQVNIEEAKAKCYRFRDPDGKVVDIYNLTKFCRGKDINQGHMSDLNLGKINQHKGWTRY